LLELLSPDQIEAGDRYIKQREVKQAQANFVEMEIASDDKDNFK